MCIITIYELGIFPPSPSPDRVALVTVGLLDQLDHKARLEVLESKVQRDT